jgi:DNA-binding HxlR family transcriptional regulator
MIIDGKELVIKIQGKTYHCALDVTMDFIGGKWKTVVLWYLRNDRQRFSELKKQIPEITEKMLSLQLRKLEKDGIIGRKVYAEVPPRVEYFLTEEGKTLIPCIEALAKWGRDRGKKFGELTELKRTKKT